MKKLLLGALLVSLFVSCNNTNEEKAIALIEDDVVKSLYHPETYDPVETRIDSAFTPFDDPTFYEKSLQLYNLIESICKYDGKMDIAKSEMSIWSGPYQTDYTKNSYQKAKDKYEENAQNKKDAEMKIEKVCEELYGLLDSDPKFIGFKAYHRYRAESNSGRIFFGEMEYLLDKDITHIISSYDIDNNEYKRVQTIKDSFLDKLDQIKKDDDDTNAIIEMAGNVPE